MGASRNCCEAAARVRVYRGCAIGAVRDGSAGTGEKTESENVVLSLPNQDGDGVAAGEAKVRA